MSPADDAPEALDISRVPRGELAAAQLVESGARLGDLAERHYLELKGPPDLTSKANRQKVAKFILGAANRSPERAAEAFEGYGVMIVGITKDGVKGVPPIEMQHLQQVIHPFLGAAGPRWDIVRVPVQDSDRQVIVVLVDPPTPGDPIFVCRENGDGLQSGRIYFRADGETREARADEMDQLIARAAARTSAAVDLQVSIVGAVTSLHVDETRTLEEFISLTRKMLLKAQTDAIARKTADESQSPIVGAAAAGRLKALREDAIGMAGGFSALLSDFEPEKRTAEKYRDEIDRWESAFRRAWPNAIVRFASAALEANEVRVVNVTKTFLHDVEITLHLEGEVEPVEPEYAPEEGPRWRDLELPGPPRPWGPTKRTSAYDTRQVIAAATAAAFPNPPNILPSDTSWRGGGSVDIKVAVGDLRPEETYQSEDREAILVIRGELPPVVNGTWKATARGYNDVFAGALQVEVTKPEELTERMRRFLKLS
jgi:hypothetical protein